MLRSRALVVLALVVVPSLAAAQSDEDKSAARALGLEGQSALDKKDFKTAVDRFQRAVAIFDDAKATVPPTLLLGLARADAAAGRFVASQEAYNRLVRQGAPAGAPPIFAQAVESAKREIDGAAAHIGSVVINVTGCEKPQVMLDEKPVSAAMIGVKKPVDPGDHVVRVTAEGCKPGQASFKVADGGEAKATVSLERLAVAVQPTVVEPAKPQPTGVEPAKPQPTAVEPVSPQPTGAVGAGTDSGAANESSISKPLAITGFVVGGAGLALGAVTGLLAMSKHSTLTSECTNAYGWCPPSAQADLDSYHTMGTLSTVGFIVGGVGVAAGAIFLITAPKSAPAKAASILPTFGPGGIGAFGRF